MLIWCIIIGVALIIIGVAMLVNPQFVHELTESWKYNGYMGEPSKLYLWSLRFGGVMLTLSGIWILILSFLPQ